MSLRSDARVPFRSPIRRHLRDVRFLLAKANAQIEKSDDDGDCAAQARYWMERVLKRRFGRILLRTVRMRVKAITITLPGRCAALSQYVLSRGGQSRFNQRFGT